MAEGRLPEQTAQCRVDGCDHPAIRYVWFAGGRHAIRMRVELCREHLENVEAEGITGLNLRPEMPR